jgi:hypothetical protein
MNDFDPGSEPSGDPSELYENDDAREGRWEPEDAAFLVDLLFKSILHRPVDTAALDAFTSALVSGAHTPQTIVAELRNSEEARQLRIEQIGRDLAYAIYPAVLGRDPDKDEANSFVRGLERASLKTAVSELLLRPEALRYQLEMITQGLGIAAVLLSQADADRDFKAKRKTSA